MMIMFVMNASKKTANSFLGCNLVPKSCDITIMLYMFL